MELKIKQECESCGGTGLYCGMAEPKGTAVVCLDCEGKGWHYHYYKPFTYRKRRNGIDKISFSRGSFVLFCGADTNKGSMTYKEFEEKINPNATKE